MLNNLLDFSVFSLLYPYLIVIRLSLFICGLLVKIIFSKHLMFVWIGVHQPWTE